MSTNSNTIIGIQNSDEETAEVIVHGSALTASGVIEHYGHKINKGAFVSVTDVDGAGVTVGITIYIADKLDTTVYLQDNAFGDETDIDNVGSTVAVGEVSVPEELETFTVYGVNDNSETFIAVVTATESTVEDVAITAGTVDEGVEHLVKIVAVLRGDQTEQAVTI